MILLLLEMSRGVEWRDVSEECAELLRKATDYPTTERPAGKRV